MPSWQEALGIFPHDGLLSTRQVKQEFAKNRWDVNSYKEVLGGLITQKELALVETHSHNAKLYGRPEVAGPMQADFDRQYAERLAKKAVAKETAKKAARRQL